MNTFGAAGGTRNDAQAKYISPNFNGFSFALDHILKGNIAAGAGPAETGISATYANGPLAVTFVHSDQGNGNKDKMLGGTYNLGMAKVAVGFYDPNGVSKGWSLGAGGLKAGPIELMLDYARNTGTSNNTSNLLFEAKYALSKRTFGYMAVLKTDNNGNDPTMTSLGIRHNF